MRRAAQMALLLLVAPATSVGATTPVEGEGWILIEFLVTDEHVSVGAEVDWVGPTTVSVHAITSEGRALADVGGVGISGEVASVGTPGAEADVDTVHFPGSAGFGRGFDDPGTYRAAVLVGGDVRSWTLYVRNSHLEPYPFVELARGTEIHSLEPRDFGPVGVDARAMAAQVYAGAGTHTITIDHEIVGVADMLDAQILLTGIGHGVSVEGPGVQRQCTCRFPDPGSEAPFSGPGTYEFRLEGAGVRAAHGPLVLVADIPLLD